MNQKVCIIGENHRSYNVVTFFVYPDGKKAVPLVIPFSILMVFAFISEGLQKLIVPYSFPISQQIPNVPIVAQISLYYENEEYLEHINDLVKELFSH